MRRPDCIVSNDTKSTIRVLFKAGYKPRAIKQVLTDAGERISIRRVYQLVQEAR